MNELTNGLGKMGLLSPHRSAPSLNLPVEDSSKAVNKFSPSLEIKEKEKKKVGEQVTTRRVVGAEEKKLINCGGLFWRPYSSILDHYDRYTSIQPILGSRFSQAQRKQEQRLQQERSSEALSKSRGKKKRKRKKSYSIRINPFCRKIGGRVDCKNEKRVSEGKVTA